MSEARMLLAASAQGLRRSGMTYRQIAAYLGISQSYTQDLCRYDPDGSKTRARKEGYRRPCPECGKRMSGHDGPNVFPARCSACDVKKRRAERRWKKEEIVAVFQEFHAVSGRPPSVVDTTYKYPSIRATLSPARVAEADRYAKLITLPSFHVVQREFGGWREALRAAGLSLNVGGTPEHRKHAA